MKTYTYGTTPTDVIRAALDAQCPEGYHISAWPRSEDYQADDNAMSLRSDILETLGIGEV